jgi:hypothetical protein
MDFNTNAEAKWIYDGDVETGYIRPRINHAFYSVVSDLYRIRYHMLKKSIVEHRLVLNSVSQLNASTRIIRYIMNESGQLEITIYTTVEHSPNMLDYYFVSFACDGSNKPKLIRGFLHRPYDTNLWDRKIPVVFFDTEGLTMHVRVEHDNIDDDIDWEE